MRIPVLSYHSINDDNSPLSLKINFFENQLKYLKKKGFKTINFDETDKKENKTIIITFDDGYKDILYNALPILKKYNFKATSFLVTNFIGDYNYWDKKKADYNKKELMNETDINEWISNGMSIGSHSHYHSDLTTISESNLINELDFSKKILEDKFNNNNNIFCYPYGKLNGKVYNFVKKIYDKALTTNRSRYDTFFHDTHLIPRIDMGKNFSNFKMFLKLNTFYEDIKYKKNEL